MANERDTLCYHGRRSVDEMIGALNAENIAVARIHKELAQMHLARFVLMMAAAANDTRDEGSPSSDPASAREAGG